MATILVKEQVPDLPFAHKNYWTDPMTTLGVGDIVCGRDEPNVLWEITFVRYGIPPGDGGLADLKFVGVSPAASQKTLELLKKRDLKNDVFSAYLMDLRVPENGMQTIAISAHGEPAEG